MSSRHTLDPSSKLQIILCGSQGDAAALRAAGYRSVRVVDDTCGVFVPGPDGFIVDPALALFGSAVLAFARGSEELRDSIAVRLGDVRCRWVEWPDDEPSAEHVARGSGIEAVRGMVDAARPMWTDEVCLLSDIPEAADVQAFASGFAMLDTHGFRLVRPAFMPIIGPYGPLPGSAEFHTKNGWKRLDKWRDGDEALVCDPITGATKYECVGRVVSPAPDGFMRLRNGATVDITACANHRWPVVGKDGKHRVMTTAEIADRGRRAHGHGSGYNLIRTFTAPDLPDLPISDEHIRLVVAVCADGSVRDKMVNNRVCVCIRKDRKRERLVQLLDAASVPFRVRNYSSRPTEFHYDFDFAENKSLAQFRNASPRQLQVVFDELQHWDGHVYANDIGTGRLVMSTSDADDAAFLEYLYSACGYRASTFTQNGNLDAQRDNYLVAANCKGSLSRVRWDRVDRVPSDDGAKYCLTTSTGFFVCRFSPGQVYVTGNSGKSVLIRQLCCNLLRLHGWRTLITSFEERVKPRYVRDLRRHIIGQECVDRNGEVSWRPVHSSEWTREDVEAADARIEGGFRFLRRKRNASLDVDRLCDRIEYAVRVYGLEVVVIDPVNEIDHDVPRHESKTDYMGRFIMRLKALADDYSLLMIVCAHPPKDGVEKRSMKGKMLTLNDGADTAHYGNKADIGWCVWRPTLDPVCPTFLNIDKLKDHEIMGAPTVAKLVLDKGYGRFNVVKVGYDVMEDMG